MPSEAPPSLPSPSRPPKSPTPQDAGEIINFPALKNWLVLLIRAALRRKRLVLGITALMVALAAVVANVLPKTYHVECRLLAQRNGVLTLQSDTGDATPTRSATELVMRRENILGLVKQTDLLKEWKAHRPFLLRIKDRVMALVSKPADDKEMTAGLADYLASKMIVYSDQSTVTIGVDWRDPVLAYRLVDAAQRAFLEARHVQEVSTVAESVSILEGHAASVRAQIDEAVSEMQNLRERKQDEETRKLPPAASARASASAAHASAPPAPPRPAEPTAAEEEQRRKLSELPVMIETKQRMISDLENYRLRRVNDLQAKLQEKKATYTEQHPAVAEAEQALQAAQVESPQVVRLKSEVRELQAEYEQLKRTAATTPNLVRGHSGGGVPNVQQPGGLKEVIRIEQESAQERDPELEYARSKLQFAISNYQTLEEQIRRARIDLDTAQAAFKYRYTMVTPPALPKGPIAPKVSRIILAALIAGLLIGVTAAAALELHEGLILEPWQVEHSTALPVLVGIRLGDGRQNE